jgi:glycosyltransferase involved in cell wall biosynthesis
MNCSEAPGVAVVVPTFNERGNVVPLVEQLDRALTGRRFQVVFADDSEDGTTEEIRRLAGSDPRVSLDHSPRRRGLARAVVDALAGVAADVVLVMDGDLQHPPAIAPKLLAELEAGADVAVASRYAPGGREIGLSGPWRRLVSRVSARLAQLSLPPARHTTDPLSGFFAFRRAVVEGATLRPVGFKILLEILVRGRLVQVVDVPYAFDRRQRAASKASAREGLAFLWHVARLRGRGR